MKILDKYRFLAEDLVFRSVPAPTQDIAIREAIAWIYRAQDTSTDRGVSHSYHLYRGWAPSYPETTGYIIPTLLNWAHVSGDNQALVRALEMADWERDIQLPGGGVIGSVVGRSTVPVVFNTGQVIFGWLAAYRATGEETYREAASRAVRWLIQQLGTDPTWAVHGNMGIDSVHTYNVRVAWSLLEYARKTGDDSPLEPAIRTIEWVLTREETPGWFNENCLSDNQRPLLHTIIYTARGLLESGLLLNERRYIAAATRTADALVAKMQSNGSLAGRFDRHWNAQVSWACLTGMAQFSILLSILSEHKRELSYAQARSTLNQFLLSRQRVNIDAPGIRGGIAGSYPVNGAYGKYRILNWATKFFIDALLYESEPGLRNSPDYHAG